MNVIPDKSVLDQISFESSVRKSLGNLKITSDVTNTVIADLNLYKANTVSISILLSNYTWRFKTAASLMFKVQRHPHMKARVVFNDLLGIRIIVSDYNIEIPDYITTKKDYTSGKEVDDGYRAIHLYYQKSNNHYPIEMQLWSEYDSVFNTWTHTHAYKYTDTEKLRSLRNLYEQGIIKSEQDFLERLK